eukprot:gnl/TRDRNA2_/TRDRNA2_188449_c0_seq1.p1 gnl/TRDRNA2_/TRDRNA2_188449_c0~~gnl/TRDRNA2_/TRDRNA2_188449_c0_seq1.p1  ORF type:complete len:385 (-),score=105.84 gnl/TRDRNA2_/TRDRNA2_188449_c0_seq1:127-1281(-)
MGAANSEVLVDYLPAGCVQVCPGLAASSQLSKRNTMLQKKKQASASWQMRHQAQESEKAAAEFGVTPMQRVKTAALDTAIGKRFASLFGAGETAAEDAGNEEEETFSRQVVDKQKKANDELMHGAMRGDIKRVRKALESGALMTLTNARGVNPLMLCASSSGKEAQDVLKELINRKADINGKDNNGWTALLHACRNGKTEIAKHLMAQGADPSVTTSDHKTALILATAEGKLELVRLLMGMKAVRQQVTEKDALGWTALHYAVKDGHLEISKMLIEQNAKVNAKDLDGKIPLMVACEHGKLDCAKVLAKKGAEINGIDRNHRTALLYAVLNTYEGVALWLLQKYNADAYMKDIQGDTPLTVADDMGLGAFRNAIKGRRQDEDDQ